MATLAPGFWFGVALQLESAQSSGAEGQEAEPNEAEEAAQLVQLAAQHWEACLACCGDASVLRTVLAAAFSQVPPDKAQLCNLASHLVQRSMRLQADGTALLELLHPFTQQQPGVLLYTAAALDNIVLELSCSVRSSAEHQELVARQVELLVCLMESPSAGVVHLAEQLASCPGATGWDSTPAASSKLSVLFHNTIGSPQAPLVQRLCAARLLALCCLASPRVFRQYRSSLEQVLQCEPSVDLVHIAACGLFESYFVHLESFSADEWGAAATSLCQGLHCPVPGIQLPAAAGACRILLLAPECPAAQEPLEQLLMELVQVLCTLEGRFGQVDWGSVAAQEGSASALHSPHDFGPHQLLQLLVGFFAELAASQPQQLLDTLGSTLCSAADRGVLQVDLISGGLASSSFAMPEVLRLKAQCRCVLRLLDGGATALGQQEACATISDRLVTVTAEGVEAWLQ